MPTNSPLRLMAAHNNLNGLLFHATSAEYYALCIQSYQLARYALKERLAQGTFRNPAIIFDLDETILDNSAYQSLLVKDGLNYHGISWDAWCRKAKAGAVPGSIEFVRFAESLGVTPFFVTSRSTATRTETLANLKLLEVYAPNSPDNDPASTRLFAGKMGTITVSNPAGLSKTYRLETKFDQRKFIQEWRGYEIILSVGDNLADYAEYYGTATDQTGKSLGHPSTASRLDSAKQDASLLGRDFILVPNVTYGGWLRALEENGFGAPDEVAQTDKPVREKLQEPNTDFTYDKWDKNQNAYPQDTIAASKLQAKRTQLP